MSERIVVTVGVCPGCSEPWPACSCGRWSAPPQTITDGGDEPPPSPYAAYVESIAAESDT